MRKVIRGLLLFILGLIILSSLCAGMWGMAEIISFINANNEQAVNVTPTQTTSWDATVNALATHVVEHSCSEEGIWTAVAETMTAPGLSPEEIEAAIAGTMSVLEATASSILSPTYTPESPD
jgi:hypothetical protein